MGKFGFCKTGHGAIRLRNRITEENIDTSHFVRYKSPAGKKPLSHYLVENYHLHSGVKQSILKEGLLKNECYECGQVPEWNGLKLTLQLDHINGNHYDNRIENLRILCPNCHSQTKNFSGKANKRNEVKVKNGKKLKFIVSKEDLQYLVNNYNLSEVAKKFKVNKDSIRMRAKKLGVEIPKFDRKEWVKSSNPKFFERKYNYYDIFTTYLDCRMNISKTARKKNCHYDTVVFAINDIKIKVLEENKDLLDLFN